MYVLAWAPSDPRAEDGVHRPAPKSLLRLYWPKQQLGVQNQKRVTFDLPQSTDEDTYARTRQPLYRRDSWPFLNLGSTALHGSHEAIRWGVSLPFQ